MFTLGGHCTIMALFLQECPHGLPVHLEEQFTIPLIQVCRPAPQVEVYTWSVPIQHLQIRTGKSSNFHTLGVIEEFVSCK